MDKANTLPVFDLIKKLIIKITRISRTLNDLSLAILNQATHKNSSYAVFDGGIAGDGEKKMSAKLR